MLKGFKDFILRGNVVDLAVAVVIGAAFSTVVTALVDGLINPLIAAIFGAPDLTGVGVFELNGAIFSVGLVLDAVFKFLIIAAAIYFIIVMPMNKLAERRKAGTEPEPRPGLRGGHIPGSRNLPYETLSRADGTLKSVDELRTAVARAGIDLVRPIVTTCGSGVTASVLALALYLLGRRDVAVYDGSWSEWGARADTPVET